MENLIICRCALRITKYTQNQQQQQQPSVNEPEALYSEIEENKHFAHVHKYDVSGILSLFLLYISDANHKTDSLIQFYTMHWFIIWVFLKSDVGREREREKDVS